MLAGAIAAAPLISNANFFSGSDDVIKVAVIGCGGRGTGAAVQALMSKQNVKIVAMADAFKDRLDECYKNVAGELANAGAGTKGTLDVPEERKFVGFDGYLKAIPLADVVILATPPGQRVLAAAKIAKQKKLNVVVGLQRHYQDSYRALFAKKDMIGDITSMQAWWNNDGVWTRPRKAGQTEMEYQMRNWYYFVWLCGDHITEQHIHNLDVINWFKGGYPVKAQGFGGRQVRKSKEHGEIFDHHYVEFHYADGSILNSQCRHMPGTSSKVDELLVGTKGKIYCDAARITDLRGKTIFQFDKSKERNPYQTEHDELFAAIAKGEYKYADAENGAYSTMTSILGRMATYSGQVIDWDKAINSGLNLHPSVYAFDAAAPVNPGPDGFYPVPVPGVTKY